MQQIQRVNVEKKGRHYIVDGTLLPSVTNVEGVLAKPALIPWAANVEREYCVEKAVETYAYYKGFEDRFKVSFDEFKATLLSNLGPKKAHAMKRDAGGDVGSGLHTMIQNRLKLMLDLEPDDEPQRSEAADIAFMAWEDWAKSVNFKPTHVETMIGSVKIGAGGTVDCVGEFDSEEHDGRRMLGDWDWKSNNPSRTAPDGIYFESKLQVSVYRAILIDMGLLNKDSVAGIVRLPKKLDDPVIKAGKSVDVKIIPSDDADKLAAGFQHVLGSWKLMKENGA